MSKSPAAMAWGWGVAAMTRLLRSPDIAQPPFAPPIPPDGELLVSHVANILHCLGPKLGLAPRGQAERIYAHGLQLTIADVVAEAHDAHHPISGSLYYEGQQDAAMAASKAFLAERTPKFLGYFETVLSRNPKGPALALGAAVTYVDLSLFQHWEGLRYAFPRATATLPKPIRISLSWSKTYARARELRPI